MKILMPHYSISDFGGIINSTEGLIRGYQALGHEVFPILLEWREYGTSRAGAAVEEGDNTVTGLYMEQRGGYRFPPSHRFGYRGATKKWKKFVREFDLVHWQVPIPTMTKENRGNDEWPELYNIDVPQIAHSHDGNIQRTPWLSVIADQLKGLGCVHSCALKGARRVMNLPMSLVPSPQWDIERRMALGVPPRDREGWLSLQTFKRWKRVDDLVRAVPFMKRDCPRQIAGGGIERYYMTSETKVKPEYMWRAKDMDFHPNLEDTTIWDAALANGMEYLDFVGNAKRDRLLARRVALIDCSWSDTYAFYGSHDNRVVIDALISGAVPIMRDWGDPDAPLQPHVNFIPLPPTEAGPRAVAKVIDDVCRDMWSSWMVKAREVLPLYDCKRAAGIFLELAEGRGDLVGRRSPTFYRGGEEALSGYFSSR